MLTIKVGDTAPPGNSDAGAGVPIAATAVVLNITVATSNASGYLTVWPAGRVYQYMPLASNLDYSDGQVVAAQVVVPLGSGGSISIYNSAGDSNVIVDVEGWY